MELLSKTAQKMLDKAATMALPSKAAVVVLLMSGTCHMSAQQDYETSPDASDSVTSPDEPISVALPIPLDSIEVPDLIHPFKITIEEDTIPTSATDTIRPSKYVDDILGQKEMKWFKGFTLSADIFGPVMYAFSDYGNAEGALRLNLKNTYFPVFEAGYTKCETTDDNTDISYKTAAPYFRIGIDYNVLKDKWQDNRLYVGLRYGFTSFTYDMSGPDMTDPIWHGTAPFRYKGMKSTSHWAEIVFGVQVKIWSKFHMGWSVRYKKPLKIGQEIYAQPYYVPGYGTTVNESCWGGTYNLIFDLNWGKKKTKDKS